MPTWNAMDLLCALLRTRERGTADQGTRDLAGGFTACPRNCCYFMMAGEQLIKEPHSAPEWRTSASLSSVTLNLGGIIKLC